MTAVFSEVAVDAHDIEAQARFWCDVLGYEILSREGSEYIEIGIEGKVPTIGFIVVPEPKTVKNRVHIDVRPSDSDQDAEVERILALGATRADIGQGEVSWVVMRDPEGNEFCILRTPLSH